jgi:tRNA pseudouridine38-40 synthase
MALYKFILAYDGTDFSGFQRQGKTRTVQGVLEKTLREVGWQEKAILFAGRTDAGVHASGQVATCALDWQHSSADLRQALNARLPDDVSILEVSKAEAEFHPRYDASSRKYQYRIYQADVRHPLRDRYAWRVWPELHKDRLDRVAALLTGRHDFAAFGRAMKKGGSTIREIFTSCWVVEGDTLRYEVEANAFLYHMVRRLVYIQVRYAQQGLNDQDIEVGLNHQILLKPGLAPAHGLTLTQVIYNGARNEMNEDEAN